MNKNEKNWRIIWNNEKNEINSFSKTKQNENNKKENEKINTNFEKMKIDFIFYLSTQIYMLFTIF